MGKAAMCIRMLQILNTGRVYKISELADILETNPRNIIEYKKELDEISVEAGFYIETIPGRYGGYKLNGNATIPSTKLSLDEKRLLVDSFNYIVSKSDFVEKDEAIKVYSKLMSNMIIEDRNLEFIAVDKIQINKDIAKIKKWYEIITNAIKNKKELKITYNWLKKPREEVVVHPYEMFIYENEWRFFGWQVGQGDVCYFKLGRIDAISLTGKSFTVWKGYRIDKYLKNGVFTQNGDMFKIVLIAKGVRAKLFKEKSFGSNQVCEDLPDGTTKVTLDMQENYSTYNFLIGCGDLVKVIEPQWLIDKMMEIIDNIKKQY